MTLDGTGHVVVRFFNVTYQDIRLSEPKAKDLLRLIDAAIVKRRPACR